MNQTTPIKLITGSLILACCLFLISCEQKNGAHGHHASPAKDVGNQQLYEQVMDIHDEVMPKMNDLYKAKSALKKRLAESPQPGETESRKINEKIAAIDSASEGMMVWMRQFNPIPDSLGEDKAKAYLESELVKVKKVQADILEVLEGTEAK